MAKLKQKFILILSLLLFIIFNHSYCEDTRKVHIVYMGDLPEGDMSVQSMHHSMLEKILGSTSSVAESLVYSYGKSFNGFAANLSPDQVETISKMEGVISVFPEKVNQLHTTRSWDFLGFSEDISGNCAEGDVIIGMLDTGIWPESESFRDDGLSAVPGKWNGVCDFGGNFSCNRKIVGVRYYTKKEPYGIDKNGHGTHTSSTAAGRKVARANYFGLGRGMARGGSPGSRIAMYKVCTSFGCLSSNILKAFDDAIYDGVDIISASIGSSTVRPYYLDEIAIGSFHAMKCGILTSVSVGNDGPNPRTATNIAPWQLTVAANSIDRRMVTRVQLGNGHTFIGRVINTIELHGAPLSLIWAGDVANYSGGSSQDLARICGNNAMNYHKVKGKVVLCDENFYDSVWDNVQLAHGAGILITIGDNNNAAISFELPATFIIQADHDKILHYIKTTENPIATILYGEESWEPMAPYVAQSSSRGPNAITPDILKPDISAPGVEILAAWSESSEASINGHKVKYNFESGTSMSCPHVTGAAAYVKAAHPTWSPAAIKSALMTTATKVDSRKHWDLEFAYGTGQVNPTNAVDPGLIFDIKARDYAKYLTPNGEDSELLKLVSFRNNSEITKEKDYSSSWDLNYPSMTLPIVDNHYIKGFFSRTVTNVGSPHAVYYAYAEVDVPEGVSVTVEPPILSFHYVGQKKTFYVFVSGPKISQRPVMSGSVVWKDRDHVVKIPLVIYTVLA